jgi:uncharacterized membrane protein (DUF106 family)
MEVLTLQSQNIVAMVKTKSDQISSLENELKIFKRRLQKSMEAQQQELRKLDGDLMKVQVEQVAKQRVLTPFYMYLRDRIQKKALPESRSYLEQVAIVQS